MAFKIIPDLYNLLQRKNGRSFFMGEFDSQFFFHQFSPSSPELCVTCV